MPFNFATFLKNVRIVVITTLTPKHRTKLLQTRKKAKFGKPKLLYPCRSFPWEHVQRFPILRKLKSNNRNV